MPAGPDEASRDHGNDFRPFRARTNGLTLTGIEAGPVGGPPVLLLHGFPECAFGWRHQLPALAAAGFRAVAPNLRGYDTSDKPPRVRDYRVEELAADVAGLADHLGGRAAVVGHDWGGIVAWYAAMRHPDRVSRLVVLNAPHPLAYLRELRRSTQAFRSWYAGFFQLPWLPERLVRANDFALARRAFRTGPCRHEPRPDDAVETYVRALAQPGALTAAINYYRAAFRRRPAALRRLARPVEASTLLIWGDQDRYLVPGLADGLEPWVPQLRVERLPTATHWVQHDEPAQVNELLVGFLSGGDRASV